MIQQKETSKISYHFTHIQTILTSVLRETASKFENLMLTKRTSQIVYSILSEAQIISCGFKKIILPSMINPYMEYQDITLVLTLSGAQDCEQISQFSKQVHKVHIVHLGICTQESKAQLKKLQFKEKNSIKGFKEQNVDFFCYLQNTFLLSTKKDKKTKDKNNPKNKPVQPQEALSQRVAVDRLCSLLFSYENFSQFEFYYPKMKQQFAKIMKDTMEAKLAILTKYNYKSITKNQGMSAVKTRVIVLSRSEQISPYILSLYYGPLAQELNVGNSCRLSSTHSIIYNTLYPLDVLSASNELTKLAEELSGGKQKKLNSVNLTEARKVLQKAYNPNMSKQEIQYHQALLKSINEFVTSNLQLLALQQSIGNKINQSGQQLKGGSIVQQVMQWCQDGKNQNKYQRYLGLILLSLTVESFWWYQKNQLISGVTDKSDVEAIEKYIKKCKDKYKIHHLQQKPPKKDQEGCEIREKCFRHEPSIVKQFIRIEEQMKQNKLIDYDVLKINQSDIDKAGKKIRTIVYINDVLGYNQLAMLLALKRPNIQFVCRDLKNTKEWAEFQLNSV